MDKHNALDCLSDIYYIRSVNSAALSIYKESFMENNELLARIHEGDEEAFRLLFAHHGEALYQSLTERSRDKRISREVLKDVFQKARATLRSSSSQPDATALWLNELAVNGLNDRLAAQIQPVDALAQPECEHNTYIPETNEQEPEAAERIICDVRKGMHEIPAQKEEHHVASNVIAIILIVLLLFAIWYIIGTLMKMGKLPQADLGFTWFSKTIFPLF